MNRSRGSRAGFAYCQARLQARYAALPGEPEWQRLTGARTLAAFLAEARTGPMQVWVHGLSAQSDAHDLERTLRTLAADLADEVAHWVPEPWCSAVAWTAWLPYLPIIEHLAGTLPCPDWPPPWSHQGTAADRRLRALLADDGQPDPDALGRAGILSLVAGHAPDQVAGRWARAWRDRWPACSRAWTHDLDCFAAGIAAHLSAFRQAAPGDAPGLRRALRERLRLQFHQHPLAPLAAFLYLALILLDLERLRAGLVRRALFPDPSPGAEDA